MKTGSTAWVFIPGRGPVEIRITAVKKETYVQYACTDGLNLVGGDMISDSYVFPTPEAAIKNRKDELDLRIQECKGFLESLERSREELNSYSEHD